MTFLEFTNHILSPFLLGMVGGLIQTRIQERSKLRKINKALRAWAHLANGEYQKK